jgi:hypothetical protein
MAPRPRLFFNDERVCECTMSSIFEIIADSRGLVEKLIVEKIRCLRDPVEPRPSSRDGCEKCQNFRSRDQNVLFGMICAFLRKSIVGEQKAPDYPTSSQAPLQPDPVSHSAGKIFVRTICSSPSSDAVHEQDAPLTHP